MTDGRAWSEWKVVGRFTAVVLGKRRLDRRLWSWTELTARNGSRSRLLLRDRTNIIGTDAVEPTAVVFVSVNVERYVNLLTYLYAEALKTVCTEDGENHLLRICVVCLKNKVLSCPFATSGCATARVECHNDFSL